MGAYPFCGNPSLLACSREFSNYFAHGAPKIAPTTADHELRPLFSKFLIARRSLLVEVLLAALNLLRTADHPRALAIEIDLMIHLVTASITQRSRNNQETVDVERLRPRWQMTVSRA